MPPVISPTINDPACLDYRRIPAGMVDPVYDEAAGEGFAVRDAAKFYRCHRECPRKGCRQAQACLATGPANEFSCRSPLFDLSARFLAVCLIAHGVHIRERHRVWRMARALGTELPEPDFWPTAEELGVDKAPPVPEDPAADLPWEGA